MTVSAQHRQQIEAKVKQCISVVEEHHGITMPHVTIDYALNSSRVAGLAFYRTNTVRFNPHFVQKYDEEFIADTVPHEVAHLAVMQVYLQQKSGKYSSLPSAHGSEWKAMMRLLGVDPKRCHSFQADEGVGRSKSKYEYKCDACGHQYFVGPKVHASIHQRRCKCGHKVLTLVNELGKVSYSTAKSKSNLINQGNNHGSGVNGGSGTGAVVVTRSGGEQLTKRQRCIDLYQANATLSRQQMIQLFIAEVGMTAAGAATYYASIKAK